MNDETVIPIANPGDFDWTRALWLFQFGACATTKLYVWANSVDDALEHAAEWLDDNAPGHLVKIGDDELLESARELGIDWDRSYEGKDFERILEHAEQDLTMVGGHTTLKNGDYLLSYEWWVDDVDDAGNVVRDRSREESEAAE